MSHEPAQREPTPTVVVGVGQAGIDIIRTLDESDGFGWGKAYDDYFDYVAVDSDPNYLANAPERATTMHLQSPAQYVMRDIAHYPYLTSSMAIYERGTDRQRPVGRYKLDNMAEPSWDTQCEVITSAIENQIERLQEEQDATVGQLNVIHVHSLGGGTGGGTFPLYATMLDEVTDTLEAQAEIDTYIAGIGVVPEILIFDNIDTVDGLWDNRYYANANAALQDLNELLTAHADDPLPVHLYSKHLELNDDLNSLTHTELEPQFTIGQPPYRHYFLFGIDEQQMQDQNRMAGLEPYRAVVDNTIAAAIYGLTMYGNQLEVWFPPFSRGEFGSFGQTQLSIPIDDVRDYCELDERVAKLREQVDPTDDDRKGTLVKKREAKIDERDELQAILDDPTAALSGFDDPGAVRGGVRDEIERTLPAGEAIAEATDDDLEAIAEAISERYDETVVPVAMDETVEYVREQGEDVQAAWRDLVNTKYRDLEVASREGFGAAATTAERATELRQFLDTAIEDLQQHIDDQQDENRGWILSDVLEWWTDGPNHEARLDTYRSHRAELDEHERQRDKLARLRDAARMRRDETLEETIKPEVESLQTEIDDLQLEIEETKDNLEAAVRDREDKIAELTDAWYGDRLGYLALDEQKVREDLDRNTLEEDLTSLAAFEEEGYLKRDFKSLAEDQIEQAYAWDSTLLTWSEVDIDDLSGDEEFGTSARAIRDIWMLHSEENNDLSDFSMARAGNHTFRRSGEDGVFPPFEDPYTVQFLTYALDSPLSKLKIYTELENAAENGTLDELVDTWDDHRWAFAYPEWYSEEMSRVILETVQLPKLPELDESHIDTEKQGGELKSWLSSYGIASYLWSADEWDKYEGDVTVKGDDEESGGVGWKYALSEHGFSFHDMKYVHPGGKAKMWYAGEISWEELLEEIRENLEEEHNLDVTLTGE